MAGIDVATSEVEQGDDESSEVFESKILFKDVAEDSDDDKTEIIPYRCHVMSHGVVHVKQKGGNMGENPIQGIEWGKYKNTASQILSRHRSLNEILQVPSHDTQIKLICEALQDKPDVLALAFPPGSQHFTQDVERAIANRSAIKLTGSLMGDDAEASPDDFFKTSQQVESGESDLDSLMAQFGGSTAFNAARAKM